MAPTIGLGLDTFGDATVDAEGKPLSQAQAIRDVVKQGELADQVGVAFIGVGGSPARFAPYAKLYREQLERFGKPAQPIGAHSPGHVAATDEQAKEELWPH